MATINDVANEANVSTATVSRVLNGTYSVTEEKVRRVMDAIEKVGYQIPVKTTPPPREEAQIENRLILTISGNLISTLMQAFQNYATAAGYQTAIAYYNSTLQFDHLSNLIARLSPILAGVLLINAPDNSKKFQSLIEPYPLVQIGEPIMERVPNIVVYNDEIKMAENATSYLLEQGCRKIGLLTAEPSAGTALFYKEMRTKGYYLALASHGIPVDQSCVQHVDISIEGGYEGMKKLLERHPDLDGVIGIVDMVAQGAIYAIRRSGKTTDDIRVFSMDNSEVWDFDNDRFTYIDPNHDEMAETAFQLLRSAICGDIRRDFRVMIPHTINQTK